MWKQHYPFQIFKGVVDDEITFSITGAQAKTTKIIPYRNKKKFAIFPTGGNITLVEQNCIPLHECRSYYQRLQ